MKACRLPPCTTSPSTLRPLLARVLREVDLRCTKPLVRSASCLPSEPCCPKRSLRRKPFDPHNQKLPSVIQKGRQPEDPRKCVQLLHREGLEVVWDFDQVVSTHGPSVRPRVVRQPAFPSSLLAASCSMRLSIFWLYAGTSSKKLSSGALSDCSPNRPRMPRPMFWICMEL